MRACNPIDKYQNDMLHLFMCLYHKLFEAIHEFRTDLKSITRLYFTYSESIKCI